MTGGSCTGVVVDTQVVVERVLAKGVDLVVVVFLALVVAVAVVVAEAGVRVASVELSC